VIPAEIPARRWTVRRVSTTCGGAVFTGLVEEKGILRARNPRGPGARVRIGCSLGPLALGDSVSVDGVCLTVDTAVEGGFEADCSQETLVRTTLGTVAIGGGVNLERAATLGQRMGGHIVSGHVDGTGIVAEKRPVGDALHVEFTMPRDLARYVAEKGSVCINGVSLTVNGVTTDRFSVVLIPHTLKKTTLDGIPVGTKVNLEVDVVARYIARLLDASHGAASADDALLAKLRSAGFT
jgi:riboflavin synthase